MRTIMTGWVGLLWMLGLCVLMAWSLVGCNSSSVADDPGYKAYKGPAKARAGLTIKPGNSDMMTPPKK